MANKLVSLDINSFRGATQPLKIQFDEKKRITMIFGDNGNGKSTVSDALIALCTDGWGSIDDRSSDDKKSYLTSITGKPENLKITLTTNGGNFSAKLSSNGSSIVKTPVSGIPPVRQLRRSQIIKLIDSQPSSRYEELKEYIDVSNISKAEDELRKANRSINNELSALTQAIQSASDTLEKAWIAEGKPLTTWQEWAKTEAEKDLTVETNSYNEISSIVTQWKTVNDTVKKYSDSKTKYEDLKASVIATAKLVEEKEKENTNQNSSILKLLKEAQTFISGTEKVDDCPVCANPVIKDKLLGSIKTRIDAMSSLDKLVNQLNGDKKRESDALVILNNSDTEYTTALQSLCDKLSTFTVPKGVAKKESINVITDTSKSIENKKDDYRKNKIAIDLFFSALNEKGVAIKKTLDQHNLIKQQYQAIIRDSAKATKTNLLFIAAKKALEITETKRKEFIEKELASISVDVETLYAKMHPNEGLGSIKLLLKPNVKNSLELKANFHTKMDIPPQSIYSESHLDTLGLAIFIALAKKYGTEDTILILDDVLMSVDESHLDRFIDMLHDVSSSFSHVLITTHYRPWRDRYRNHRAPTSEVHFIELRNWSIEKGIRLQNGKNAISELREVINADYFDRQKIASLSGTTLENLLDFLTVLYQCRLPRKAKNDYALRELLDSFSAKLQKVLKVQHLEKDTTTGKIIEGKYLKEVEIKPIIDRIKELSAVRNQVGAHYNFDGSLVNDKDVTEFAELTLELAETMSCPDTGAFPDRDKSGSYFETKSGVVRLNPLREPSN
jgi:ABC-type transport system involved in cytochrome c biogenesis ATPase subunit